MSLLLFTKRIFQYFKGRLVKILVLLIVGSLLEGTSLLLLLPVLQLTIGGAESQSKILNSLNSMMDKIGFQFTLETGLTLFLLIFTIQSMFFYFREASVATNIAYIRLWLRDRLYGAIFDSKWSFFLQEKRGTLVSAILVDCEKAGNAIYEYMLLWTTIATIIVYSSAALIVSWEFTITIFVISLLMFIILNKVIGRGRNIGKTTSEVNAEFQSLLNEHFDSARLIKGSGLVKMTANLMHKNAERLADLERNVLSHNAKIRSYSEPIAVGLLCVGIYLAISIFRIGMAELMVILFIFFRLFPRVIQINQIYFQTLVYVPSFERVECLTEKTIALKEPKVRLGTCFNGLKNGIELRKICYSYKKGKPVLHSVSLEIEKGATVALVGESGAGKSTISDLILGLLDPDSGKILLDSRPLKEYDLLTWRKRIGYVTQEPILLHDTVKNNIIWGANENLMEADVYRASKLANAHEFIKDFPQGYETVIGDRGVRISGGQRQRLTLARALARNPELLILDEATSSLDSESEQKVQMAIDGLSHSMSILVIAHRLSTIKRADNIYVLEQGQIVESGTYPELIERNGRFRELYELQASQGQSL